jgi:hypothetical protein
MAAASFCRNALAGALPLLVDLSERKVVRALQHNPANSETVFTRMTFQGASSLLGGVGLLLR